jgi:hypothetical protein
MVENALRKTHGGLMLCSEILTVLIQIPNRFIDNYAYVYIIATALISTTLTGTL